MYQCERGARQFGWNTKRGRQQKQAAFAFPSPCRFLLFAVPRLIWLRYLIFTPERRFFAAATPGRPSGTRGAARPALRQPPAPPRPAPPPSAQGRRGFPFRSHRRSPARRVRFRLRAGPFLAPPPRGARGPWSRGCEAARARRGSRAAAGGDGQTDHHLRMPLPGRRHLRHRQPGQPRLDQHRRVRGWGGGAAGSCRGRGAAGRGWRRPGLSAVEAGCRGPLVQNPALLFLKENGAFFVPGLTLSVGADDRRLLLRARGGPVLRVSWAVCASEHPRVRSGAEGRWAGGFCPVCVRSVPKTSSFCLAWCSASVRGPNSSKHSRCVLYSGGVFKARRAGWWQGTPLAVLSLSLWFGCVVSVSPAWTLAGSAWGEEESLRQAQRSALPIGRPCSPCLLCSSSCLGPWRVHPPSSVLQ